jgi:tetratricopeptide (TPR) repeat protein
VTRPTDIDQEERAVGAAFRAALPPPPGTTDPDALEAAFLGSLRAAPSDPPPPPDLAPRLAGIARRALARARRRALLRRVAAAAALLLLLAGCATATGYFAGLLRHVPLGADFKSFAAAHPDSKVLVRDGRGALSWESVRSGSFGETATSGPFEYRFDGTAESNRLVQASVSLAGADATAARLAAENRFGPPDAHKFILQSGFVFELFGWKNAEQAAILCIVAEGPEEMREKALGFFVAEPGVPVFPRHKEGMPIIDELVFDPAVSGTRENPFVALPDVPPTNAISGYAQCVRGSIVLDVDRAVGDAVFSQLDGYRGFRQVGPDDADATISFQAGTVWMFFARENCSTSSVWFSTDGAWAALTDDYAHLAIPEDRRAALREALAPLARQERALVNPDDSEIRQSIWQELYRGECLTVAGDPEGAYAVATNALTRINRSCMTDPTLEAVAQNNAAWALHLLGRDAEALPLARVSVGKWEMPFNLDTLANILGALGKTNEAEATIERAIALLKTISPEQFGGMDSATERERFYRFHLAQIWARAGKTDEARAAIERLRGEGFVPAEPAQLLAFDRLAKDLGLAPLATNTVPVP